MRQKKVLGLLLFLLLAGLVGGPAWLTYRQTHQDSKVPSNCQRQTNPDRICTGSANQNTVAAGDLKIPDVQGLPGGKPETALTKKRTPSEEPQKQYEYYETLADVEEELEEKEHLKVLLVPAGSD